MPVTLEYIKSRKVCRNPETLLERYDNILTAMLINLTHVFIQLFDEVDDSHNDVD